MEWTSQTPVSIPQQVIRTTSSDQQQQQQQPQDEPSKNSNVEKKGKFIQRIKQACVMCGSRRVKCDGLQPCNNCVRSNFDCTYKEPKKRGPAKGSVRNSSSKRASGTQDQEQDAKKLQRRSSSDVHSQSFNSHSQLPLHLRPQSGGSQSDYAQSTSSSPMNAVDGFAHGRSPQERIGQQRDYLSLETSRSPASLSTGRFDGNRVQLQPPSYISPDLSRERDPRSGFSTMHPSGTVTDSRYSNSIPLAVQAQTAPLIDQSSSRLYYSAGVNSGEVQQRMAQSYPVHQAPSHLQPQTQPQAQFPLSRPIDRHPTRNESNLRQQSGENHQLSHHLLNRSLEAENVETKRAFAAGSTWQPATRSMPGPLPVASSNSSNSPSSTSQAPSAGRGPLYSHYRGGTSGLGFFDNAKKRRQLPPLDFERESTPGGSLRGGGVSLDSNPQLAPILGDSNSESRPSTSTFKSPSSSWKPPILGGAPGSVSLPSPLGSTSRFSSNSDDNVLESYDAPENIRFGNGCLRAIAQERRRESSKLIMGNMVKNFVERTPNMSESSISNSRAGSENFGKEASTFTSGEQDSPASAGQTSTKGKEKANEELTRTTGGRSNVRRRENSPDEEEAPLALLDMGGLLADEISPLVITASQPRVPTVVVDHLWKIFTSIIHIHWPVLYRPSLGVHDGRYRIDPERQPLLFNSIGAIAAATWEGNIDAPPEIRKASEMNSNTRPAGMTDKEADDLEDARIIMRLNGAQLSTVFFVRARYYLLRAMLEPTLEVIQSLIFMALCENGIGRAVAADQFSSLACRMCLDLGLHRYSDVSKAMGDELSHEEDQAHRRTFYCCYVLDKHSAAMLGRPPVLRWVETDCPFPSTEEHDEFENWGEQAAAVLRPETALAFRFSPIRSISASVATVKLCTIVERILSQYNTVKEKLDPELRAETWEGPALRHQLLLEQWDKELPDGLRWEFPANQLPHVLLLHLWFQITRIILHRPFILKQPTLPQLPSSHQECTHAVSRICQILDLYESMFSLRKLSSTFVFILFTASTVALANLTSNDVIVAQTAKRHLRQFMRWLAIISETWPSAGHHLKILENLGQGIDANLAGTGLDPVAEANMNSQPLEGEVDEQEFVRVHDASFWEAMPLSSQESVWNNFTNSYLEAINSLRPMVEQHDAQSATVNQPLPQDQLESNNLQLQDHQTNNHQLQHGAQSSLTPFQPPVRQVRRRHTQSSSTLDHALAPPRFH